MTTDPNYNDWFPHPSPDEKWLVFVSFDKSVKGHPPNKDVVSADLPLSGGKPKVPRPRSSAAGNYQRAFLVAGQQDDRVCELSLYPPVSRDRRRIAFGRVPRALGKESLIDLDATPASLRTAYGLLWRGEAVGRGSLAGTQAKHAAEVGQVRKPVAAAICLSVNWLPWSNCLARSKRIRSASS